MLATPLRLILLLALLVVQTVQAEVFRVFGAHDGFPKYFEEDGEAKGIVVDISKHCLNQMQVPYQIQLLPWKRAYTMAERSEGGVIGLSISDERLACSTFPKQFSPSISCWWCRKAASLPTRTSLT